MIQLQALNYLLDSKDSKFISENSLNEDYFSDYKSEFKYISDHLNEYGNIPDKETFLSKFDNFDIIVVNENSNYLIKELLKDKNSRMMASTFNSIRDLLNKGDVNQAMNVFMHASENAATSVSSVKSVDILKDKSRYDAYIEKTRDFSKYYIKTGFRELDQIIGGWDRKEELATIVARSNVGKSWILIKTAIAAAEQGLTVGIYSGEMTPNKVGYRIDTLFGHISNRGLIQGNVELQNDYKKLIDSLDEKIKGTIKILTPAMINGPAGVSALKNFIETDNLDMLCIDQHSLLEDDRKAKNPVEKAANISRDLKNLQVLKQIPFVSVSQQNRNSTEGGTDLSHIAQADRIGQDSTVVLFFEQKDGIMTLNLVKSRDSENGKKIQYALDFDKGNFIYIPNDGDESGKVDCENLRQQYENDIPSGEDVF